MLHFAVPKEELHDCYYERLSICKLNNNTSYLVYVTPSLPRYRNNLEQGWIK